MRITVALFGDYFLWWMNTHLPLSSVLSRGTKCVEISRKNPNVGVCARKWVRVCAFMVMKKRLTHSSAEKPELCNSFLFIILINNGALHYKKTRFRKCGTHWTSFCAALPQPQQSSRYLLASMHNANAHAPVFPVRFGPQRLCSCGCKVKHKTSACMSAVCGCCVLSAACSLRHSETVALVKYAHP